MNSALLLDSVDFFRIDANRKLDLSRRSDLGQFMTPPATARLMVSMFRANIDHIRLLDAGAGVGSLTAVFVSEISSRTEKPKTIQATAFEIDPALAAYLEDTLRQCARASLESGVRFQSDLVCRDFIDEGVRLLRANRCSFHRPPTIAPS